MSQFKHFALLLLSSLALISCGGGGSVEDAPRCSDQTVLSYSWTYQGYQPTNPLLFTVGKSTTYRAVVTGLPAACRDAARFSQDTFLPRSWISVDPATGDITGFPVDPQFCVGPEPILPGGGCSTSIALVLKIPGYGDVSRGFFILLRKDK